MQAKEGINLPPVHHIGFSASNNPNAKHNGDVVTISDINTWELKIKKPAVTEALLEKAAPSATGILGLADKVTDMHGEVIDDFLATMLSMVSRDHTSRGQEFKLIRSISAQLQKVEPVYKKLRQLKENVQDITALKDRMQLTMVSLKQGSKKAPDAGAMAQKSSELTQKSSELAKLAKKNERDTKNNEHGLRHLTAKQGTVSEANEGHGIVWWCVAVLVSGQVLIGVGLVFNQKQRLNDLYNYAGGRLSPTSNPRNKIHII